MHMFFRKYRGALIGACALIRTNTVNINSLVAVQSAKQIFCEIDSPATYDTVSISMIRNKIGVRKLHHKVNYLAIQVTLRKHAHAVYRDFLQF